MNLDHIRQRLANGFHPFVLTTSDGRRVEVPHPEFLIVGRNVVGILGANDVITKIDALHIVSIADLPAKRKKK
jgi:hypothetical protein